MSANEDLASVKILKFDPAVDKEARFETFKVPYEGRTALHVLESVYRDFDRNLAFRLGCEGKGDCRCGACAVEVNGLPVLACRRIAEREMVIKPIAKFEVIKDLVINFDKTKKGVSKKVPSVEIAIDSDKCVKCGDCISICPVGVYEAKKGEITASGAEFCCGDTCWQCISYCQTMAISIEKR